MGMRMTTPYGDAQRRRSGPLPCGDALVIGLLNNMPDAELENTEKQFRDLLDAASSGIPVRLRLFTLPTVPRCDATRTRVLESYEDIAALSDERLDGLIVTGTEPRARSLTEEPFWPAFISLVDWAEEHTLSTIWSCLAAHGAVLHLDGIERHPYASKLSGVFECEQATAHHPFVMDQPSRWFVPHSRHNGLAEELLAAKGYRTLLRSAATGPHMFMRQRQSLFLFLQGHPEYDRHALHREYRRDVGRFLRGRSDRYPEIPSNYFEADAVACLTEFRTLAMRERCRELIAEFPSLDDAAIIHNWSAAAVALYRGWLTYLQGERASGSRRFYSRGNREAALTSMVSMG